MDYRRLVRSLIVRIRELEQEVGDLEEALEEAAEENAHYSEQRYHELRCQVEHQPNQAQSEADEASQTPTEVMMERPDIERFLRDTKQYTDWRAGPSPFRLALVCEYVLSLEAEGRKITGRIVDDEEMNQALLDWAGACPFSISKSQVCILVPIPISIAGSGRTGHADG